MSDTQETKTVRLGNFPDVTPEQWHEVVQRDLKGAPFEKRLVTKTHEGFSINPLYMMENAVAETAGRGVPGSAPYTRGATPLGAVENGWDVRQCYSLADAPACNEAMRNDLKRGATSVWVMMDRAGQQGQDADDPKAADYIGQDGVCVQTAEDFNRLFNGLDSSTPISLQTGANALPYLALWLASKKDADAQTLTGSLGYDPLGALARNNAIPTSLQNAFDLMADMMAWADEHAPKLRTTLVDTTTYPEAGATAVQELAAALATGLNYIKQVNQRGISLQTATNQLLFSVSVGRDFFTEIAKLRALRLLWSRLIEALGGDETAKRLYLRAQTSRRSKTARDPWVNLLRVTSECFSAIAGGAEIISTSPFDEMLGMSENFSRRLATNTQSILKEEANLHRVIDPAGGSWYVENLTNQLCEAAWTLFQQIESQGGMSEVLQNGWFQQQLSTVNSAKRKAVQKRKDPITGVSEFANVEEKSIERTSQDLATVKTRMAESLQALRKEHDQKTAAQVLMENSFELAERTAAAIEAAKSGASLGTLSSALFANTEGCHIPAFTFNNEAAPFEELRDASDAHLQKTGRRPSVFLANMGPIPKHKGRAEWSSNFFQAGGFEIVANDGFNNATDCAAAFTESKADIAIICSSDDLYPESVPDVAPALKAAGVKHLLLAGRPGEKEADYKAAGVDAFIYLGCDVYETLRTTLSEIGVLA